MIKYPARDLKNIPINQFHFVDGKSAMILVSIREEKKEGFRPLLLQYI
jgi:hypothetical protein